MSYTINKNNELLKDDKIIYQLSFDTESFEYLLDKKIVENNSPSPFQTILSRNEDEETIIYSTKDYKISFDKSTKIYKIITDKLFVSEINKSETDNKCNKFIDYFLEIKDSFINEVCIFGYCKLFFDIDSHNGELITFEAVEEFIKSLKLFFLDYKINLNCYTLYNGDSSYHIITDLCTYNFYLIDLVNLYENSKYNTSEIKIDKNCYVGKNITLRAPLCKKIMKSESKKLKKPILNDSIYLQNRYLSDDGGEYNYNYNISNYYISNVTDNFYSFSNNGIVSGHVVDEEYVLKNYKKLECKDIYSDEKLQTYCYGFLVKSVVINKIQDLCNKYFWIKKSPNEYKYLTVKKDLNSYYILLNKLKDNKYLIYKCNRYYFDEKEFNLINNICIVKKLNGIEIDYFGKKIELGERPIKQIETLNDIVELTDISIHIDKKSLTQYFIDDSSMIYSL